MEGASEEERVAQAALAKSERMQQVLSALAVLASSSGVASERQQFMELVKDEIGMECVGGYVCGVYGAVHMLTVYDGAAHLSYTQHESPTPSHTNALNYTAHAC